MTAHSARTATNALIDRGPSALVMSIALARARDSNYGIRASKRRGNTIRRGQPEADAVAWIEPAHRLTWPAATS